MSAIPAILTESFPPLSALFAPGSIAVVGASERPGSVGRAIMENLAGFAGPVYPVSPTHSVVLNQRAYPRLAALPGVPDLVVIVIPGKAVPSVVRECAELGIGMAIVIGAGFHECGEEGAALERETLAAAAGRVRLLGPNCLGVMVPKSGLNASFAPGLAPAGSVAFLSQSGALCSAILDWSQRENVGLSAFVSMGAMADLGWGDLIEHFGQDPATKSIVCYMESVGDARAFLAAARKVAPKKPIVILKVGQTSAGARAAASHTGALTGSDEVVSAVFDRASVIRVRNVGDLFDMAKALARQPLPRGPRLAILTNAGGPGALAADQAAGAGARVAELSPEAVAALDQWLPPQWSHANPVDLLGAADAALYGRAAEYLLAEPGVDGLLVVLTPQSMTTPDQTAAELVRVAAESNKPILASWMGGGLVEAGRARLKSAGIPNYDYPDAAARVFALMWQQRRQAEALHQAPAETPPIYHDQPRETAGLLLEKVRKQGRTLLTEIESNRVLAAYGIPVLTTKAAQTEDEAAELARQIGFPVAVKLWSETLTHKAQVDGVRLGLRNPTDVRRAWQDIRSAVSQHGKPGDFFGVVVQPMARGGGLELILGCSVDPQFGPVVLFGAGGSLVESLRDRALGLPVFEKKEARRLMEQTRIFSALKARAARGELSLEQLEDVLLRFSRLVADQPWIAEMDVNPLAVSKEGAVALDARIVMHLASMKEEALPRLALESELLPKTKL